MNDNEADGSRIAHGAEALDDAGGLKAQTMVRQRFGEHDLAWFRAAVLTGRHHPFRFGAAVGGDDAAVAEDAENAAWRVGQTPHRAAFVTA